jgi:hypothetical protein
MIGVGNAPKKPVMRTVVGEMLDESSEIVPTLDATWKI